MAIFPVLELEKTVQVDDKTRLDGTKSFISKGENPVTLVRIRPEATESFITVTGSTSKDWFLDWIYQTSGTKTVTIEITTDTTPTSSPVTVTKDFTLSIVTFSEDALFSGDQDLIEFEHDVLKYVRPGRNSWLDFHRKAQELILSWIDEKGYVNTSGSKITKDDFVDVSEVTEWSTALTLRLIFQTLSNATDDIFGVKSKLYMSMEQERRSRAVIRLDLDSDTALDIGEALTPNTTRMLRR